MPRLPSVAKQAVRDTLARAGFSLERLPNRLGPGYHLVTLLRTYAADGVLDVGANRGQFGLSLREAGYRGPILSFEPVAEAFAELQRVTAADPLWETRQLGLAEEATSREMNVTASTSVSSFLTPTQDYVSGYAGARTARTETIQLSTLDSLDLPYRRPFLKIDTQGYDLRVLAGATELLKRVVGVQLEMSVLPIYEGMPDYIESLTRMRELGFVPSGFFAPIGAAADPGLRLGEFDGVFVHRDYDHLP